MLVRCVPAGFYKDGQYAGKIRRSRQVMKQDDFKIVALFTVSVRFCVSELEERRG